MLQLFDKNNGVYEFPDGSKYTSAQIHELGEYDILFEKDCVVEVVDGVIKSYMTLGDLAYSYGIEYSTHSEDDPQEVLDQVIEKRDHIRAHPPVSISDTVLAATKMLALNFDDKQAVTVMDLYDPYEVGHAYKKDDRFTYNGALFKVNQDHTSAEQWVPGATGTESLYTAITLNDEGYPVWQQPTGAHDAYNTGDIVEYKTKLYKSKINGNSWAPDVYPAGWELYTEDESSDTETPTEPSTDPSEDGGDTEASYPDFVQPTGAHDAYKLGDIVKFNGQLYKSTIDNNVWSPDAYPQGWELYTEE